MHRFVLGVNIINVQLFPLLLYIFVQLFPLLLYIFVQLFPLLLYIFVQRELWIESCLAERTTSSFEVSLMIMIVMYFHIYFESCNIGTH